VNGGQTKIGRLALREEGDNWTAYYALADSMDGALWLGSVRLAVVADHPERKQLFIALMSEAIADILEDATGQRPSWGGLERAPEHERAGRA